MYMIFVLRIAHRKHGIYEVASSKFVKDLSLLRLFYYNSTECLRPKTAQVEFHTTYLKSIHFFGHYRGHTLTSFYTQTKMCAFSMIKALRMSIAALAHPMDR